ncbi:hypothetical protein BDR26DRAFT_422008 [Obelidium mucronatum]|nr:hypothetical protein BDR26DRAFT_422008 [Obelidium mucronatum]
MMTIFRWAKLMSQHPRGFPTVNLQPNPPRNSIAASSSQLGSPSTPTKSIIPATPTESQPPTPTNRTSSPQQTNRSSKHTIETFVREEIIRAFTPPLPETENRSFSSSNSTIAIPKRVDSIMDDGFVYVDGNYLHVNGQGVVSSFHEKNLPPTPSVVAERNAEGGLISLNSWRTRDWLYLLELLATMNPQGGILRGPESPPIPSIGGASKKVSIKEPTTVPEVDMPKSNWFGAWAKSF